MQAQSDFVFGQRYAFATLAMILALLSFINLAGMEKAILAIVLAKSAYRVTRAGPRTSTRLGEGRRRAGCHSHRPGRQRDSVEPGLSGEVVEVLRAISDVR